MKRFFLFILSAILIGVATNAQQKPLFLKASDNTLFNYGRTAKVTTTDSTTVLKLDSIVIASNETGIVEVQLIGWNDSTKTAITGSKIARYVKNAGTLTLGTATDVLATVRDSELDSSTTWSIASSGNNIVVRIKGKDGYTIRWFANIRRIYVKT